MSNAITVQAIIRTIKSLVSIAHGVLLRAADKDVDSHKLAQRIANGIKKYYKENGIPCERWGVGNSKTLTASTYRPVGGTCHSSCPFLGNGCYAQGGNVNIHQNACDGSVDAGIYAAIAAMVTSLVAFNTPARLHVSGDFTEMDSNNVDTDYVQALSFAASIITGELELPIYTVVAYTYTHIPGFTTSYFGESLRESGVVVLQSDALQAGGAIVMSHDEVREARKNVIDVKLAKCLSQTAGKSCRECGLCWESYDKNLCIVFDPHGSGKKKASKASAEALKVNF